MMFDWDEFLARLEAYPAQSHRVLPPVSGQLIKAVEMELGGLPLILGESQERFNGAELFIVGGPLVTFFRISSVPPLPSLEWAEGWSINEFTVKWRAVIPNRNDDWAIAMTNYGGLVLMEPSGKVREWDTSSREWISNSVPFDQWIEKMMSEGDSIVAV